MEQEGRTMTLHKLLTLIEENNIPTDVKLTSDSGWECGSTEVDGVWYNSVANTIVFTQSEDTYCTSAYKYGQTKHWKLLTEGESK